MNHRATVLVIDDEPGIREMLAFALADDGFRVETAENGRAALAKLAHAKFEIAITDLRMPDMDGVATVEALKRADPEIEVIVATGYASVETAVACMKRGAYDYIQKPYDIGDLKYLLGRVLDKRRLQDAVSLYEASRELLVTLKHDDLIARAAPLARKALRADDVGILVSTGSAKPFELHRLPGAVEPEDEVLVELGKRAAGDRSSSRAPLERGASLRVEAGKGSSVSAISYPLFGASRTLGALVVVRSGASPAFTSLERKKGAVFAQELALALDNAGLMEELERKLLELIETRERLVQVEKLALAGSLAGSVAHEVNNPLTFVRANVEALQSCASIVERLWDAAKGAARYLEERASPLAREHAERLLGAGGDECRTARQLGELSEVIEDVTAGVQRIGDLVAGFTRLAVPKEGSRPEWADLNDIVRESIDALPSAAQCRLRAVLPEKGPHVIFADRNEVRSALVHIIGYLSSPEHKRAEPPSEVVVETVSGSARPRLVVRDASLRLTGDEKRQIFDPRVEVEHGVARTMRLNLARALAYQMLCRNGAEISVGGEGDPGARVEIVFPAA